MQDWLVTYQRRGARARLCHQSGVLHSGRAPPAPHATPPAVPLPRAGRRHAVAPARATTHSQRQPARVTPSRACARACARARVSRRARQHVTPLNVRDAAQRRERPEKSGSAIPCGRALARRRPSSRLRQRLDHVLPRALERVPGRCSEECHTSHSSEVHAKLVTRRGAASADLGDSAAREDRGSRPESPPH